MKASAAALAVLAAACTRDVSGPPKAQTAAPASSTASSAPPSTVELKPGPHSPLADVDLPAGVAFAGSSSLEERWTDSAPYDDTVAFFRRQFATGRKYDPHGATWWRDLPPCYNDKNESPPGGTCQPKFVDHPGPVIPRGVDVIHPDVHRSP